MLRSVHHGDDASDFAKSWLWQSAQTILRDPALLSLAREHQRSWILQDLVAAEKDPERGRNQQSKTGDGDVLSNRLMHANSYLFFSPCMCLAALREAALVVVVYYLLFCLLQILALIIRGFT